ncbi:MAG: uroporphyrinogen-III synthase [Tabrizicola sp.]|nr:uroporphyrinogen-III synthase [Tabrizicola sp.]
MARQSTSDPLPVLLTRPEEQSRAFAANLVQRFGSRLRPVISPLMAIEYLTPDVPEGPFSGLIFTSANAVEAALRLRFPLPNKAWCVGEKTASRAGAAGFAARSADGDADALVAAILASPPEGRLLHLRGEDTRGEVADRLRAGGVETAEAVVYRMSRCALSTEAKELLQSKGVVIVPLFSPRSAMLFSEELPEDRMARLQLVALSAAIAEAATVPDADMVVVRKPSALAMLDAIGNFLDKGASP